MKKIGIISDTHSYLDPVIFEHFKDVDEIWHAGDIGNPEVMDQLTAFKPFRGVWGNIDSQELRKTLPKITRFQCEDVKVMMIHIGGYPGRYAPGVKDELLKNLPDLFICGHSHILKVMNDKSLNFLHINPGAAGKEGMHQVRTLIRLSVTGKRMHDLEVIEMKK